MEVGNQQSPLNKETTPSLMKKGNFTYFVNQLESILNKMCETSTELILCGDSNVNYLNDNSRKHLLDSLLASFSLFSTVKFPTRIFSYSCTLIDNIYINIYRHDFSAHPLINPYPANVENKVSSY